MLREDLTEDQLRAEMAFTAGQLAGLLAVAYERGYTDADVGDLIRLTPHAAMHIRLDWYGAIET